MSVLIVVILLGVVEGITEFIPISSTGHLLVTERLLQMGGVLAADHWLVRASAHKDLFNVVIQGGAVLAVLPLFRERLHQFFFRAKELETRDYLAKLALAFVITAIGGFILDQCHFKLPETLPPVALALLIGGVLFLVVEALLKGKSLRNEITWTIAVAVGLAQIAAAVFPGSSRSGATIIIALALGLNRVAATEFTFLVGIPTLLAAGGWKILKMLSHAGGGPPHFWALVLLGSVVAAIVSFVAVKWLLRYVQTHTFTAFGWYRIGVAAVLGLLLLA